MIRSLCFFFCFIFAQSAMAAGNPPAAKNADPFQESGQVLYLKTCAACHGGDGRGAPPIQLGFDVAPPDFTDCDFASREADVDWFIVAEKGGPARGFSELMPAFGDALSPRQIRKILEHIRTFCANHDWPRGELNLPRPLITTKAYPEDELVLAMSLNTEGLKRFSTDLIYEQRFGARNQVEVIIPLGWAQLEKPGGGDTEWISGVGDIGLALKRVIFHSLDAGAIFSLAGELLFPTGDEDRGFGSGTMIFEPYAAYGQILPSDFFMQLQGGVGLPLDDDQANEEAFWRGVVGRSFYLGKYGRRWTPMVEILGAEELVSGSSADWDVVPQLQVTLNDRQHVRFCVGAKVPLNDTDVREPVYMAYLLWDWFDGGFFQGW